MGTFDLKMIDSSNKAQLERLAFAKSELLRLKAEEERVAKSLDVFRREVVSIERRIVEDPPVGIAKNAYEVLDAWDASGFCSEIVKKAIALVRLIFFNDQDEAYQKFSCTDVDQGVSLHCTGIRLTFECREDGRAFSVYVPLKMLFGPDSEIHDIDTTSAMFQLLEKVGRGQNIVYLERCKTFSYAEMADAIEKIVRGKAEGETSSNEDQADAS